MTAPGTIMMAKIPEPRTATPQNARRRQGGDPPHRRERVDAAARGTTDGLHLMLNVIAMLVSFIALNRASPTGCSGGSTACSAGSRQHPDRARLDLQPDRLGDGRAVAR